VVTDPKTNKLTNKLTHKQTGPITIHCAAKLSAQCKYWVFLKYVIRDKSHFICSERHFYIILFNSFFFFFLFFSLLSLVFILLYLLYYLFVSA